MVVGQSVLGAPGMPSVRRVPEQLISRGGDSLDARVLQDAFLAERAGNPRLTPEQFLMRLDEESTLGRVVSALLGPETFRLLRTTDRAQFESALRTHYREFRHMPPPFDAGTTYGSHRYVDGSHVPLRDSGLVVLPMNAPRYDRTGQALYPNWDIARERGNRSVAAVQASRVWGREIPLDQQGRELFETLDLDDSLDTFDNYLDPELRQTRVQTAFTLSTGYTPIYRSSIEVPGAKKPTGLRYSPRRNAEQARWLLAARLGRSDILEASASDLARIQGSLPAAGRAKRPPVSVPDDAFTQLSTDELFAVARELPTAPRVLLNTFEWEHHRSQRFARRMNTIADSLGLDAAWRSRFAMLTGLCEPENLHFVPPWQHALEDLYAGGLSRERGRFRAAAFATNRARADRWGNVLVDPDFARHADLERAQDAAVSYEPRHLIELLSALQDPVVQQAVRGLRGANAARWLGLARQLNRAADVYGISPGLRLAEQMP